MPQPAASRARQWLEKVYSWAAAPRLARGVSVHDRAQEVAASIDLHGDAGGNGCVHRGLGRHRKPGREGRLAGWRSTGRPNGEDVPECVELAVARVGRDRVENVVVEV